MNFLKKRNSIERQRMQTNTNLNRQLSKAISLLRFPLIVLVICIHVNQSRKGIFEEWLVNAVCAIAVPAFFVISGILFFKSGFTWSIYYNSLKKRLHTLLIPYIIWNAIAIALIAIPHYNNYHFTFQNIIIGFWDTHTSFIMAKGHSPMDFPLWYVRDLMICCIFSPAYYILIRHTNYLFPLLMLIIWISGFSISIVGFSTDALTFFSIGCFVAQHKLNLASPRLLKASTGIMVIFIFFSLLGIYDFYNHKNIIFKLCQLSILINIFPMSAWISKHCVKTYNIISSLAKYVFFIYASHALIITPVSRYCYLLIDPTLVAFLSSVIITISICLLAALISQRSRITNRFLNG